MPGIVHLDITVDCEEPLPAMRELVKKVKPDWDVEKLTYDDKSTGYVNRNYKVYVSGNKDALLLRCIALAITRNLTVGEKQKIAHTFIHEQNLGPKLLCTLTNAVCVEFLQGRTPSWEGRKEIYDDKIWPQTAETLALYHSKKMYENAKQVGTIPQREDVMRNAKVKTSFEKARNTVLDAESRKALPAGSVYSEDIEWYVRTADKLTPGRRFVHMDANPTNWLIRDDTGEVVLIDYDLISIFYPSADIAWFFLLHGDFRNLNLNDYPDIEYQRKWLRHYLTKRRQLDGETKDVTDDDVDKLRADVDVGLLFAYLQCITAGLFVSMLNQKEGGEEIKVRTPLIAWEAFKKTKAEYVRMGYV